MTPNTEISCGAVIYRNLLGKMQVLLVKQNSTHTGWGIPKGHMEPGESYVETAKREVKEETGVSIKILTRLPHVTFEKRTHTKVVIPYLAIQTCNATPTHVHQNSEVSEVKWFDINNLPVIYYYQKPIIDAALLILEGYVK